MSKYRKIDPRIWNDAKFRSLSDSGKLVFFMLLTHPNMTALGAMRATISGLAEELGWTTEAFREAFREGCAKGMAEHDQKACFIALPKFLRYNPPESPNVIKAWTASLDMLPECGLKDRAIARARAYAEGMTEGFAKALPQAFAKTMPYQEQEQEPEQEQEEDSDPYGSTNQQADPTAPGLELVSGSEKPAAARSSQKILDAYHAILPNCARIEVLGDKRLRLLQLADKQARKVCREQGWVYDAEVFWSEFFTECARDPWLRGDVPNPKNASWKQSLMILIREEHFAKVMDGAIAAMRKAAA